MTTQQVADEFEKGFGPEVSKMQGFRQYLGATIITDDQLVFFFNVFETRSQAEIAQTKAADFKKNGVLNDQIGKVRFSEGQYDFLFTSNNCGSLKSHYIVTRIWQLIDAASFTAQDVADELEAGYAPDVMKRDGFNAYGGVILDSGMNLFYNSFTTEAAAADASSGAAGFFANGKLNGQVKKVQFDEGKISFHLLCDNSVNAANRPFVSAVVAILLVVVTLFAVL